METLVAWVSRPLLQLNWVGAAATLGSSPWFTPPATVCVWGYPAKIQGRCLQGLRPQSTAGEERDPRGPPPPPFAGSAGITLESSVDSLCWQLSQWHSAPVQAHSHVQDDDLCALQRLGLDSKACLLTQIKAAAAPTEGTGREKTKPFLDGYTGPNLPVRGGPSQSPLSPLEAASISELLSRPTPGAGGGGSPDRSC